MVNCKVSVCIPTYNYAAFLAETIESILSQHFADFELLIIDDNSTDDTRSIVERYTRKDPRIRFSVNPWNLGMVENWNLCLAQARGEYIKFVFGDDLLASPDTLGRMAALLDADSSVSLVCSARNFIDERSHVLKVESHFEKAGIMAGTDVINSCLTKKKNLIGEPSVVMFRKIQAARGFRVNYRQIVDLEMWFHLLELGSFAYIDEPLCSFRIHDRQQTAKNKENMSDLNDFFYMMDDYLDKEYIALSGFMKMYVRYDNLYGIWKLYKRKKLSREAALELINTHGSFVSFRFWYPFYKLFKPCLKLYRKFSQLW
ncbi:MAG: glycosyltransferase family 2 protein [Desulfuromonadales bacterium]|nr:glycosyltransferase family 2 protein [Desulfuromonadales bacterium]